MNRFEYKLDEHVAVVTMNSGENRFNNDFLAEFGELLDKLEKETEASVLVVTSGHDKIWSNGIDLEWLVPEVAKDPTEAAKFPARIMKLLRRLLAYPMLTVAAINGHAFAGGAIMACAFDFRFMRSDRGYLCFPEVDIHIPFMPGMDALITKAMPRYLALEAELTGRRYTAAELEAEHVVAKACHVDELMKEVMAFAKTVNKGRSIVKTMKEVTFKNILRVMENDDPVYLAGMPNSFVEK
jgi:enoyl-CoA hydratase/carnithine racemase